MRVQKHIASLIILIVVFIASLILYKNWQIQDTKDVKTQLAMQSNDLLVNYFDNQDHNRLIDKAIEVEGQIHEINESKQNYSILLKGNQKDTFVICEMQKDQNTLIKNLQNGENIRVKGIFKGFLKDAILLNCILIDTTDE